MKHTDKLLFEFFWDIRGIESLRDSYDKLNILYESAKSGIEHETYSDINVKDKYGNTFLHYAFMANHSQWAITLLRKGANPYIKNRKNRNVFQSGSGYDFFSRFYEKHFRQLYFSQPDYQHNTHMFHPAFQQYLFEERLHQNITSFKHTSEVVGFLNHNQLMTDENLINLLAISLQIPWQNKIEHLVQSGLNTPDNNSLLILRMVENIGLLKNEKDLNWIYEHDFAPHKHFYYAMINHHFNDRFDNDKASRRETLLLNFMIDYAVQHEFDLQTPFHNDNVSVLSHWEDLRKNHPDVHYHITQSYLHAQLHKENTDRLKCDKHFVKRKI